MLLFAGMPCAVPLAEHANHPVRSFCMQKHRLRMSSRFPAERLPASGAWICGEQTLDPALDCVDLLVLLPLPNCDDRYAKHYLE